MTAGFTKHTKMKFSNLNLKQNRQSWFNKKYIFDHPMGSIGYSFPIRLAPTYILPAVEIRLSHLALKLTDQFA